MVAAGRDIPAGVRLGFTSLHYVEIPKRYLTPDMAVASNQLVGRFTREFIAEGEPILPQMLLPGRNGLSLNIETHERAVTLSLSEDALVDHSICPGDLVDILVTSTRDGKKYTRTICQEVRVLMAVSRQALLNPRNRNNDINRITLAVSPIESEKLAEAVEVGKVRLVLRNRLSRIQENLPGVGERDLLPAQALIEPLPSKPDWPPSAGMPSPPPPLIAPPPPVAPEQAQEVKTPLEWVVEVVTGNHREKYAVPQR